MRGDHGKDMPKDFNLVSVIVGDLSMADDASKLLTGSRGYSGLCTLKAKLSARDLTICIGMGNLD